MAEESVTFNMEQFKELLSELRANGKSAGLGAVPNVGLAWGPGLGGNNGPDIIRMLEAGSPRLALAKSLGVPMAPYILNVKATFPDTDTPGVPDVGSDVKITQDTLVEALIVRVTNDTGGQSNIFQPQSDFFYQYQSGIEATLDVKGAPRYSVAPNFTPLSTLADMINGKWPQGWILTYQQQLFMSFNARILPLAFAPLTVICSYRAWIPVGEMFVQMTNREAFERLAEAGITCSDAYMNFWCRG